MKYLLPLLLVALFVPHITHASSPLGLLIKSESSPAVYFAYNDKRFVFPNEAVYSSWYSDFDDVVTVPDAELAALPLGGNVTFKPGSLIKIESDPRVYAVSHLGYLHWLTTETVAKNLYGEGWSTLVHDVPVTSFMDYAEDEPIEEGEDVSPDVTSAIQQLAQNMKKRYAPILTLLQDDGVNQATIRMDAATEEDAGWSSIIEGATRFDPIIAICEYTWCELSIQYTTPVSYTAFTTFNGNPDPVASNTITFE